MYPAEKQVLKETETESPPWIVGQQAGQTTHGIKMPVHGGGTWVVEVSTPDGNWIDIDQDFEGVGYRIFNAMPGDILRLRNPDGNSGAVAFAKGVAA